MYILQREYRFGLRKNGLRKKKKKNKKKKKKGGYLCVRVSVGNNQ